MDNLDLSFLNIRPIPWNELPQWVGKPVWVSMSLEAFCNDCKDNEDCEDCDLQEVHKKGGYISGWGIVDSYTIHNGYNSVTIIWNNEYQVYMNFEKQIIVSDFQYTPDKFLFYPQPI